MALDKWIRLTGVFAAVALAAYLDYVLPPLVRGVIAPPIYAAFRWLGL